MQPQAFIDLAERLIAHEKNPEGFRSAISRAIMAPSCKPKISCIAHEHLPITDKKHQEVLQILADTGDNDVNEAAAILGDLRDEAIARLQTQG